MFFRRLRACLARRRPKSSAVTPVHHNETDDSQQSIIAEKPFFDFGSRRRVAGQPNPLELARNINPLSSTKEVSALLCDGDCMNGVYVFRCECNPLYNTLASLYF
eukprot:TRINITY_DN13752_c0_g1_i1.p1 TRINITY_DN13752_c0_g1~~TRINITY_DN13752_c0_g1_i1.p1  ORF type:complete len:105 (+),score=2.80 TRINITY_DN13752_c0_g1_i1:52-366(+)